MSEQKLPSWLYQEKTYQMLEHKQRYKGYQNYIAHSVDEDIKRYYSHYNILSVLGSAEFKKSAIESSKEAESDEIRKALINKPGTDEIIKLVCHYAKTNEINIRVKRRESGNPTPHEPLRCLPVAAMEAAVKNS